MTDPKSAIIYEEYPKLVALAYTALVIPRLDKKLEAATREAAAEAGTSPEDFTRLTARPAYAPSKEREALEERLVALLKARRPHVKDSDVHVNGWEASIYLPLSVFRLLEEGLGNSSTPELRMWASNKAGRWTAGLTGSASSDLTRFVKSFENTSKPYAAARAAIEEDQALVDELAEIVREDLLRRARLLKEGWAEEEEAYRWFRERLAPGELA